MEKIMAVNAGSSSLKFQLFEMPDETVLTSGIFERIGLDNPSFTIKIKGEKIEKELPINDHQVAVDVLLQALVEYGVVNSLDEITGVGHRIVHGGEKFSESVLITDELINEVEKLSDLAPLHNPANIIGYRSFKKALPNASQTAIFDTAFHQSMEEHSYLYALPYEYYLDYKVRKYGFHGTSHLYVSNKVAALMNKKPEEINVITCHLGNGASLAAIKKGKSIDTSMGFTPLTGVMMGTRTGDIDPQIVTYLQGKLEKTTNEIIDIFNKKSGMLGVSGVSSDARDIQSEINKGNKRAILTRKMYAKRICDYIGSYFVQLGHVDALVFTAGLGENDTGVRKDILDILKEPLNIDYDEKINEERGQVLKLSTANSKVDVWVVPTDEEVVIARDTYNLMSK